MRIHFVGIGGVSMRQLANLLSSKGYQVSGSDISIDGHKAENVDGADAVVYTAAVKKDNVELVRARELGLPIIERAVLLGRIAAMYHNSIAVAGTHGKTTVTGMLSKIFLHLEPTVHMGGTMQTRQEYSIASGNEEIHKQVYDTEYRERADGNAPHKKAISSQNETGSSFPNNNMFFITEACEYNKSFLNLLPSLAIILNIELDHTDCYADLNDITNVFSQFAASAKKMVIINADSRLAFSQSTKDYTTFGLTPDCDYYARSLSADSEGCFSFFAYKYGKALGSFKLSVAGIHNVKNALAAIAAADYFGISLLRIQQGLSDFYGISRRFEFVGCLNKSSASHREHFKRVLSDCKNNGKDNSYDMIRVFSDYAHHPREIECSVLTARAAGAGNLIAVFEPHTYSRTQSFLDGFAQSLMLADKIILLPVYAARETNNHKISSLDIWRKIAVAGGRAIHFCTYSQTAEYLKNVSKSGDTILCMGAGSIDKLACLLTES